MIILQNNEKLDSEKLFNLVGQIKALIYARVSTVDQALHGHSLESQIEKCKERAINKFGYKEDEIIALVEGGGMGDDPNRPVLNYTLFLLEKGLGRKLIILHPDRLARDNTLQGQLSRRIWNLGIDIEFVEFEVDPTNPESMLMYNIQGSISQYNKAKIHANSKRGRTQKAKKGEIPIFSRLYGYTFDSETDKLMINEVEKEVILEMSKLLLEHDKSTVQIAQILSEKGYPAPKSDMWHSTTVLRILRNETYKGIYYYGKTAIVQTQGKRKQVKKPKEEWIAIPIPSIFNDVEYEKIQLKLNTLGSKKGRKSDSYLLKGIVVCGRCGYAVRSGITSKTSTTVHKYYACTRKKARAFKVGSGEKQKECKGKNWRSDYVDQVIWNTVVGYVNNPSKLIEEITKEQSDVNTLNTLQKQKETLENKIESLRKEENRYILLFGKDKITEQQFDDFTNPINKQIQSLMGDLEIVVNQIATFENKFDVLDVLVGNIKKYQELVKQQNISTEEKRGLIKMYIKKVILHEDDSIDIILKWEDELCQSHKNIDCSRANGIVFYASVNTDLKEVKPQQPSTFKDFLLHWNEIYDMHYNQLITFNQIRKKFGMTKSVLENLFNEHNCEIIKKDKLYEMRVSKDAEFICDLIYNQKYSKRKITQDYGFSIEYIHKAIEMNKTNSLL